MDSSRVKFRKSKIAAIYIRKQNIGNQKARDHKKNVDTNKAALELRKGVEDHHKKNGNRTKTIDIRAIGVPYRMQIDIILPSDKELRGPMPRLST